jgi:hypothetical protein
VCGAVFSQARLAVPAAFADHTYWMAIEVRFECRACGFLSPLNHLDVDGDVTCLHCGTMQRFALDDWASIIEEAHALGENTSHFNYDIGTSHTFVEFSEARQRVRLSPGNPLCGKCRSPYQLVGRNEASLAAHCPTCRETRTFELPPQARGRFRGLAGVLGIEHEANRPPARLNRTSAGVVALQCPRCGGGLNPSPESSLAHCQYCQTTCLIDSSAMWQSGMKRLAPQWWWLLLQGEPPEATSEERPEAAAPAPAWQSSAASAEGNDAAAKKGSSPLVIALICVSMLALVGLAAYQLPKVGMIEAARPVASPPVAPAKAPAAAAPSAAAVDLLWKAKVTKATGVGLKKNAACTIQASTNGRSFSAMQVRCSDQVLYDSQQTLNGMSSTSSVLAESPVGDDESQGIAYAALYNDIGARQGRAQVTLDTTQRQAVVFSEAAPVFRVELETEMASEPRHGKALFFGGPAHRKPLERAFKVVSAIGATTVRAEESCRVSVRLVNHLKQASVCAAAVSCGKQVLYGQPKEMTGSGSVVPKYQAACQLDAATGYPATFSDQTGSVQGSPKLELDLRAGTAVISDDTDKPYSLTLTSAP